MALHRLVRATVGVPDVAAAAAFYRELGLDEVAPGSFATTDGGVQLELVASPRRRLERLTLACDDPEDLDGIASSVAGLELGVAASRDGDVLDVVEPVTETAVTVEVAPRADSPRRTQAGFNAPGAYERFDARADGVVRTERVRPRKLSHVVLGSPDEPTTRRFFVEGLGFLVSDEVAGAAAFLRCSTEHHNLLVQSAPVPYLHHTSWQVDDVDEIGRGAGAMLATDPGRHVWGLGRHFIGSNFFWYLRDPAGNFAEYSSDIDVIVDDEVWEPGVWSGLRSLMAWGPPVPPSFLAPDDLAELMSGIGS